MTENEILTALKVCANEDDGCEQCPYYGIGSSSCLVQAQNDAAELIKRQNAEIEHLRNLINLAEQDIADRDEMLKQKVEVVYADFMRDYKAMSEELEGVYKDLEDDRRDHKEFAEQLKKELSAKGSALQSIVYIAKRIPQTICDNCYPDFNREGLPVTVWKTREGYTAIDALVEQIVKEAAV